MNLGRCKSYALLIQSFVSGRLEGAGGRKYIFISKKRRELASSNISYS